MQTLGLRTHQVVNGRPTNQGGFSLIDILVTLAIIAALITTVDAVLVNAAGVARVESCSATMETIASDITNFEIQQRDTLTKELVDWYAPLPDHYWYVANTSDRNRGHGNDLDGCDEENPGQSTKNRDCIPMRWVILCDHDHSAEGIKYMFRLDGMPPQLVPLSENTDQPFLRDAYWWTGKDPRFDRWFGNSPK